MITAAIGIRTIVPLLMVAGIVALIVILSRRKRR